MIILRNFLKHAGIFDEHLHSFYKILQNFIANLNKINHDTSLYV